MAYFKKIKTTYAKFGIHARIRYRQGALRIIARSKKLHQFLVKNLKMTPGKYKARKTKIPKSFERFAVPVLRGIFDGDG
ncbi:MAG: hypothetical protein Q8P02_00605 [Candidatus Micrarchaeota archaeon]|nr:hypothetical protein [Candidatus Micrarchaeota archaeon]